MAAKSTQPNRWQKLQDIREGDLIKVMDPATKTLVFAPVARIEREKFENMTMVRCFTELWDPNTPSRDGMIGGVARTYFEGQYER